MHQEIANWASCQPRIRRVWACDGRLALELEPVADSEETFAVWMAHGQRWSDEVRARIDPQLELAWLDPDGASLPPEEAKLLVYERGMQ
jgi:hypothetical protein